MNILPHNPNHLRILKWSLTAALALGGVACTGNSTGGPSPNTTAASAAPSPDATPSTLESGSGALTPQDVTRLRQDLTMFSNNENGAIHADSKACLRAAQDYAGTLDRLKKTDPNLDSDLIGDNLQTIAPSQDDC